MNLPDIVSVLLIIAVLGALAIFLQKDMDRLKHKYKENARRLLNEQNPDPKALKQARKCLHMSIGQSRDEEGRQLIKRLTEKLSQDLNDPFCR
jgi:hypothetical protein